MVGYGVYCAVDWIYLVEDAIRTIENVKDSDFTVSLISAAALYACRHGAAIIFLRRWIVVF